MSILFLALLEVFESKSVTLPSLKERQISLSLLPSQWRQIVSIICSLSMESCTTSVTSEGSTACQLDTPRVSYAEVSFIQRDQHEYNCEQDVISELKG